ncbi:contact-dependent growth inhibition system immunity protein [Massilia sp. BSC265]|uniref:contact-dependent growth inhibition system immunity protein n=1 Tax=Massilia sp. BSC265 TaxID=1549812 RepID=UPI00056A29F6
MAEQHDELSRFFGCYFHQDWNLDDHSWEDVVRRFVAESGQSAAHSLAGQITKLTESAESDADLAKAIESFGCYYCPSSHPEMRAWLKDLCAALDVQRVRNR